MLLEVLDGGLRGAEEDRDRLIGAVLVVVEVGLDLVRGLSDEGRHLADDGRVLGRLGPGQHQLVDDVVPDEHGGLPVDDLPPGGRELDGADLVHADLGRVLLVVHDLERPQAQDHDPEEDEDDEADDGQSQGRTGGDLFG